MRVFRLNQSTQHPVLVETKSAQPSPGESEVVIRVRAVGVTPSELLWYPTSHNEDGSARSGAVPGHEFSGEIAAIGEHVPGVLCRRCSVRNERLVCRRGHRGILRCRRDQYWSQAGQLDASRAGRRGPNRCAHSLAGPSRSRETAAW